MNDALRPHEIDPSDLDIEDTERGEYVLTLLGEPLKTPNGHPITSRDKRLLRHMIRELQASQIIDVTFMSAYSLYCTQRDMVEQGQDWLALDMRNALMRDPVLYRSAGPEQVLQMYEWESLMVFLDQHGQRLPLAQFELKDEFVQLVQDTYSQLDAPHRTAVINLSSLHGSVLLGLMLVLGRCTASEYAIGIVAAEGGHGDSMGQAWHEHAESYTGAREDAQVALDYLLHYSAVPDIGGMLEKGETDTLEFKATLRTNLRSGERDKAMEFEVCKTLAAFWNSEGGTLLVGVGDDGEVCGIEVEGFDGSDHVTRVFYETVERTFGNGPTRLHRLLWTRTVYYQGKHVFVVDCERSPYPVEIEHKRPGAHKSEMEFYVRSGPRSCRLTGSEMSEYASRRFAQD